MPKVFLLLAALLLAGCGYKPLGAYKDEITGECVYVKVEGNLRDPQNTIDIKNAVHEAVLERFGSRLCDRERANSHIDVRIRRIGFQTLEYDKYGYAIYYRAITSLEFRYKKRDAKETKRFVTQGYYDFGVEQNSVITDRLRYEAIKESSKRAIDHFLAQLFHEGAT
jgi:outer membrane lipopolysaccharide assembly protein LptE/RlpB